MSNTAVLSLNSVRVRFGGLVALNLEELSLSDSAGVAAIFVGPNGAGKTTLLNAITGYAPIEPGGAIILHRDRDVELHRLARSGIVNAGVTRTFQTPLLFASLTVRESMLVAGRFGPGLPLRRWASSVVRRPDADRSVVHLVEALLESLDLCDVADQGLQSLSLPVVRRAELGRCLAAQPRVLMMLDEPTAGADAAERNVLVQFLTQRLTPLVTELSRANLFRFSRVTAGVVTHDMELARALSTNAALPPHVHVLHEGRVFAHGSLSSIVVDPRVRAIYLGAA